MDGWAAVEIFLFLSVVTCRVFFKVWPWWSLDSHKTRFQCISVVVMRWGSTVFWETVSVHQNALKSTGYLSFVGRVAQFTSAIWKIRDFLSWSPLFIWAKFTSSNVLKCKLLLFMSRLIVSKRFFIFSCFFFISAKQSDAPSFHVQDVTA